MVSFLMCFLLGLRTRILSAIMGNTYCDAYVVSTFLFNSKRTRNKLVLQKFSSGLLQVTRMTKVLQDLLKVI